MARKLYIGVGDKARRIRKAYIGSPSSFYLTAENFYTHPGIINEGVTFTGTSPVKGTCMYFNGSSRILIPSLPDVGGDSWTIDWLEYPVDSSTGSRFSSSYTIDSVACGGILFGYSNSKMYASNEADISNWNLIAGADMFSTTANTWTHWAVVKQGTTIKTYRNGTLYASTACNGRIGLSSKYYMAIGDYRAGDHSYFKGYMDFFRVSNYARYTGNFTYTHGKESGVARRIKKIYLGVNGVAKLIGEFKTITGSFNINGGTGTTPGSISQSKIFDSNDTIPVTMPSESGFSKSGYKLVYWTTDAAGNGTKYIPGAVVNISVSTTFYAQWVRLYRVYYWKNATLNSSASVMYPDISDETGPASLLISTINYPEKYAPYFTARNLNDNWHKKFETDYDLDDSSFGQWQYYNYGTTSVSSILVPEGTTISITMSNNYTKGSNVCRFFSGNCQYGNNDLGTATVLASGNPVSWTFSIDKDQYLRAIWRTEGADYSWIGGGDDRQSWWDVYNYS